LIHLAFSGFLLMRPSPYPFCNRGQKKLGKSFQQGERLRFRLGLCGTFILFCAILLFSSQLALAQFAQQGPKLVGTGAVGPAEQGVSVALSADGNTAVVGGWGDNTGVGGGLGLHPQQRCLDPAG
jgi:hypothetical protein